MAQLHAIQPMSENTICNASVTIVDADVDSAEALQALIRGLPGVANVRAVDSTDAALSLLAGAGAMVADVYAYAATNVVVQQIVLIDLGDMPPDESRARAAIASLRAASPGMAIVMLCVYPEHARGPICGLADMCLAKDTSPAELRALLAGLRCC